MTSPFEDIAAAIKERGFATIDEVRRVAAFAKDSGSAQAFAMLGDVIQLLDDSSQFELNDAEAAYLRAVEIDPAYAEGYTSLGYFYDSVRDDPERARAFFERAIALGDAEAAEGLHVVLAELDDA
jgi:tetratricopeptide (TPR) repeat protein